MVCPDGNYNDSVRRRKYRDQEKRQIYIALRRRLLAEIDLVPADAEHGIGGIEAGADAVARDEIDSGALGREGEARGADALDRALQAGLRGGASEAIDVRPLS
jgi:hypothetical protein